MSSFGQWFNVAGCIEFRGTTLGAPLVLWDTCCTVLAGKLVSSPSPSLGFRHGMLALARANSFAAPSEPEAVDEEAPLAHPTEMGAFEPQFAGPVPSHGGLAVSQCVFAALWSPCLHRVHASRAGVCRQDHSDTAVKTTLGSVCQLLC